MSNVHFSVPQMKCVSTDYSSEDFLRINMLLNAKLKACSKNALKLCKNERVVIRQLIKKADRAANSSSSEAERKALHQHRCLQ